MRPRYGSRPPLAAQLNLAAYRLAPTADIRAQLMNTFASPYTSRLTGHTVVQLLSLPHAALHRAHRVMGPGAGNTRSV